MNKYERMRRYGVSERSVQNCMALDGVRGGNADQETHDQNSQNSQNERYGRRWTFLTTATARVSRALSSVFASVVGRRGNDASNEVQENHVIETVSTDNPVTTAEAAGNDIRGARTSAEQQQNNRRHKNLFQDRRFAAPTLQEVISARSRLKSTV